MTVNSQHSSLRSSCSPVLLLKRGCLSYRVIKEAQEASLLSSAVPVCSAVEVHLSGVPEEAAARVVASVQAFAQVSPAVLSTQRGFSALLGPCR